MTYQPFFVAGLRYQRRSLIAVVLLSAACTESSTDRLSAPAFELVDPRQRIDPSLINAHTYGSFVLSIEGGPVTIRSGPANFPGNPPGGPGTCDDGLWINSRGKPTAGSLTHPHPHCISSTKAAVVVLEPISSNAWNPRQVCKEGSLCHFLYFTDPRLDLGVEFTPGIKGESGQTNGDGVIVGYAIDASTLNGANVRVGTLTIDLNQYDLPYRDQFGTCSLDDASTYECLPLVVYASYEPLAVGGIGTAQKVPGFLWWSPTSVPYNY